MSNLKKSATLSEKIKTARKSVGLSQKQLGDILKVSDKAVSSYEVGRAAPSVDTLKEISKVTYKPMSYFVNTGASQQEIVLEEKIQTIERELREIKEILRKQKK